MPLELSGIVGETTFVSDDIYDFLEEKEKEAWISFKS
jgi:hypothetical protein